MQRITLVFALFLGLFVTSTASAQVRDKKPTAVAAQVSTPVETFEQQVASQLEALMVPQGKYNLHQKTEATYANVGQNFEADCISSYANAYADDLTTTTNGGSPERSSSVQVYIQKFNTCTQTELESSWGWAVPNSLTFQKGGARVTGFVTVTDAVSGDESEIEIDLLLQAIDGSNFWKSRQGSTSQELVTTWQSDGIAKNMKATGKFRRGSEDFLAMGQQDAAVGMYSGTYTERTKKQ